MRKMGNESIKKTGNDNWRRLLPPFSTTVLPKVWKVLFDCLRFSKQVEIQYKTPGKEPVSRIIDPYHGVRFEGVWYVVGLCYLRNEIRTFSMSRILTAKKTGEVFQIPTDFNFKKLSGSHFGVHWSEKEINVKIRFNKRVADYVRERTWHPSQEIMECENKDVILSLTVNHLLELKRWILSWGDDPLVLEPASFVQDIMITLNRSTELYSSR